MENSKKIEIKFQTQFSAVLAPTRKQQEVKCKRACEIMVKSAGFTTPGTNAGSINVATMNSKKKLELSVSAESGYRRIDENTNAGKPTCVAVDREYTGDVGNANNASDHFVVIYERLIIDGVVHYRFADPGTSHESLGMSESNLLSMKNGFLQGESKYKPGLTYTVTEVRPTN